MPWTPPPPPPTTCCRALSWSGLVRVVSCRSPAHDHVHASCMDRACLLLWVSLFMCVFTFPSQKKNKIRSVGRAGKGRTKTKHQDLGKKSPRGRSKTKQDQGLEKTPRGRRVVGVGVAGGGGGGGFFFFRAMGCMCAQTRPRFILLSERVFFLFLFLFFFFGGVGEGRGGGGGGMESGPM